LSQEAEEENVRQTYDATKAARTFGINFRTYEEVLHDYTDFVFSYQK